MNGHKAALLAAALLGLLVLSPTSDGQAFAPSGVTNLVTTAYCGANKTCLVYPPQCLSPNCTAIATWTPSATPGYVDFELMAVTNGWVALGLSTDTLMGNDSVTACVFNSNTNALWVNVTYNNPNPQFDRPLSYMPLPGTLINETASYINGQVHCRYSRMIAGYGPEVFTLNASYYLLLGFGPAPGGVIAEHNIFPTVSPTSYNVVQVPAVTVPPTAGPSNAFVDGYGNKVTFQVSPDGTSIQFTISGPVSKSGWIAVAFSKDQLMGDDSVLDCILATNGSVIIQSSFNGVYVNNVNSPPSLGILPSPAPVGTYSNGILQCTMSRSIASNSPAIFPLNVAYYLFLAYGAVDGNAVKQWHTQKTISAAPINVQTASGGNTGSTSSGRCDVCLVRAHGVLMITAWVLLVSTSIIIARYYRTAWPDQKLCTTDVWFSLHRFLMLLALACTISGFIIIFVYGYGKLPAYPPGSPSYFWVHAPLGIVVMILVILNPIMAAFRCHPGTRFRPIYNWLHWMVGTACHVVALITMFFGIKIGEQPGTTHISHIAIFWILIAFVGFHVVVEIILGIDKAINDARTKKSFQVQYEMSKPGEVPRVLPPTTNSCSLIFRYIILAFYFLIVMGLWLAMIILIGSGRV